MEDADEDSSKPSSPPDLSFLSVEANKHLFDLLLKRGYFHDGVDPETAPQPPHSSEDASCRIAVLDGGNSYCCTYPVLEEKLTKELEHRDGRAAVECLKEALRLLNDKPLLRILQQQNKFFQVGDEIVSHLFLDLSAKNVLDGILHESGFALVSDVASREFQLPVDVALKALQERLPEEGLSILHLEAGACLVSDDYMEDYQDKVLQCCASLQEPCTIADLCHAHHWDAVLVGGWIKESCNNKQLQGHFHGGSNATTIGSMYTPHAYVKAQRQGVDELFSAQGYMTAARGVALGLSKSKMGEYIQESFPSAVVVSDSLVVSAESILTPLEAVLQEAVSTNSFVDLRDHVTADILEQEEDVKLILNDHVLPSLGTDGDAKKRKKKKQSTVVLSAAIGGLFVSEGLVRNIRQKILPDLIAKYAKARAEELDAAGAAGECNNNQSSKSKSATFKKKGGRKGKKAFKAQEEQHNQDGHAEDVVPLIEVVKSLGAEYPELMEVDLAMAQDLQAAESGNDSLPQLVWERTIDTGQTGGDGSSNEGLVCEFCRAALYDEEFVSKCQGAIESELKRLQSARLSKASVSRKDAAAKVRNVETAFEEAFANACNLLQAQAKFLQYVQSAENSGDEQSKQQLVAKLTCEFLQGCCADFTSRLTQYCLFKNEVDPGMFKFVVEDEDSIDAVLISSDGEEVQVESKPDNGLPHYCTPPDLAIRQLPQTYLSLGDDETPPNVKEPLPKLREVLPGSLGVTLARQWVMCGGICYQGGTKVDDSGHEFTRPGDLEKFMAHVEENCLSLCGLPFKKLDKKSEKHFLFARRQQLLQSLDATTNDDAGPVLDHTILLLFQQVKNIVAFGSSLHPEILKFLTSERKINEEVAKALLDLAESIRVGAQVEAALIAMVKACGLSRDISKHQIG